ncbi:MAG: haloalkane dehalogenase [Chloroflexota bacterium]
MPLIQTPDERFDNLPGYDYAPNYVTVQGFRMHYVDAGQGDEVVLCLHGEPTWSYLYRKMIPPLAEQYRVIAPDFVGFGRSDKLTEMDEYSIQLLYDTLTAFIEALDLRQITLVCQDYGGIVGLPVAVDMPDRFARLVIMNTGLPTGERTPTEGFMQWRAFVERIGREMIVSQLIELSMVKKDQFTPDILRAYDAPFPDERYRAAIATYPLRVPIKPDDPFADKLRETRKKLSQWQKPALVMFSDSDPVTGGGDRAFRKLIPTANDQPEITIKGAGHFLQEESGEEIAGHIRDFMARTGA